MEDRPNRKKFFGDKYNSAASRGDQPVERIGNDNPDDEPLDSETRSSYSRDNDRSSSERSGSTRRSDDRSSDRRGGFSRGSDDRGGSDRSGSDRRTSSYSSYSRGSDRNSGSDRRGGSDYRGDRSSGNDRNSSERSSFRNSDRSGSDRRGDDRAGSFSKSRFGSERPENKEMVFGVQSVLETLKSGKEIDKLFIQRELGNSEIVKLAEDRNIPVSRVPMEKLDRLTRKNHQGAICFISAINYVSLHNVLSGVFEQGKEPLVLILDRITDVRNFGAIARTAECVGVQAIVVPTKGAAEISSDAMKTSSGALNFLPVAREANLSETLRYLQESGIQVVACTEKGEETIYDIDFSIPTAIIMGSEEDGVSNELIRKADHIAKIPMTGQIGSLNVSVATGVVLYEVIRQRIKR